MYFRDWSLRILSKEDNFLYQHLFCKVSKLKHNFSLEVLQIAPEMASAALYYTDSNFYKNMHYKLGRK